MTELVFNILVTVDWIVLDPSDGWCWCTLDGCRQGEFSTGLDNTIMEHVTIAFNFWCGKLFNNNDSVSHNTWFRGAGHVDSLDTDVVFERFSQIWNSESASLLGLWSTPCLPHISSDLVGFNNVTINRSTTIVSWWRPLNGNSLTLDISNTNVDWH